MVSTINIHERMSDILLYGRATPVAVLDFVIGVIILLVQSLGNVFLRNIPDILRVFI